MVLHPVQFLPYRSTTNVHNDKTRDVFTTYVTSKSGGRLLRTYPDDENSTHLPSFKHSSMRDDDKKNLNVFFVILNAYTKFRRFLYYEFMYTDPEKPLSARRAQSHGPYHRTRPVALLVPDTTGAKILKEAIGSRQSERRDS